MTLIMCHMYLYVYMHKYACTHIPSLSPSFSVSPCSLPHPLSPSLSHTQKTFLKISLKRKESKFLEYMGL